MFQDSGNQQAVAGLPFISATSRPLRILFIYPPVRLHAPARYPPFGLLYLAAVLQQAGHKVEIIDLNILRLRFQEIMDLVATKEFDIIGMGGMTTVYYYLKLLSLHLKKRYPHIPIIGGGSACSASPEIVLRHTGIDVACIGEGEPIICELVERLHEGGDISGIAGIGYLEPDGAYHETKKRPRLDDIQSLPYPAYDLVDMEAYIQNNSKVYARDSVISKRIKECGIDPEKARRSVSLFSKRGCPFGCNFCYRNFGRKVVYTDIDYTLEHMSWLEKKYDTANFVFNDEIFNVKRDWVIEFCQRVVKEDRKYVLGTNNGLRANVLDQELVDAMYDAGFRQCGIGIESFYGPTLKAMGKGQKAETIINALRMVKEKGMFVNSAQFLFGYETDSMESMKINVATLEELGMAKGNFSIPCPYPGTYLYDKAREAGHIPDEEGWLLELADRDISDRVINMSGMPDEELFSIVQWGRDQINILAIQPEYPRVAQVLKKLQPIGRKFNIDAQETISKLWALRNFYKKKPKPGDTNYFSWDDAYSGKGDEYLRHEVFALLDEWKEKEGEPARLQKQLVGV